jgi:hypothetical protein
MEKRFSSHISEAFSSKKNQCHYLNNSIRKYGKDNFLVELIEICQIQDADEREAFYILGYNTMFPNGYNLKLGTITTRLSEEGKRRVSDGVHRYYEEQKFTRFLDIDTHLIEQDISYHIRPLRRQKVQYGWYVWIEGKKADFGGIHIPLDVSYERARQFIHDLQKQHIARHMDAGNSLESFTTTSS